MKDRLKIKLAFYKQAWKDFKTLSSLHIPHSLVHADYVLLLNRQPPPIYDTWDLIKAIAES